MLQNNEELYKLNFDYQFTYTIVCKARVNNIIIMIRLRIIYIYDKNGLMKCKSLKELNGVLNLLELSIEEMHV